MTNVALPLHRRLHHAGAIAHLVSGNMPASAAADNFVVGLNGRGFRELRPDIMSSVVHIHGLWTPFEWQAVRESRRRGALIVMSPHGSLEPWAFDHKRTKKRIAWWLYQKHILQMADLLLVNSDQEARRLRELGLVPPVAVIPNGVDLEGIPTDLATREREKTILFFSRIDPKKGVPDLIDAWRSLTAHHGHSLKICGHGDAAYMAEIRARIEQTGLANVSLVAPVFGSERWTLFSRASIYVLPSYSENFGITVAEALIAGLPVITTKSTPWGALATEGIGWIVGNDVAELASALRSAIELDSAALQRMRQKAMSYADQKFSWDAIALQYVDTYNWIASPGTTRPPWVSLD